MKYIINPYQDNWRDQSAITTPILFLAAKHTKSLKNFSEKIN